MITFKDLLSKINNSYLKEMSLINKNDQSLNPNKYKVEVHSDHSRHFHFTDYQNTFKIKLNFDTFEIEYISKKGFKTQKSKIKQESIWSDYELSNERDMLFDWLNKPNKISPQYSNIEVIKQEFERLN